MSDSKQNLEGKSKKCNFCHLQQQDSPPPEVGLIHLCTWFSSPPSLQGRKSFRSKQG